MDNTVPASMRVSTARKRTRGELLPATIHPKNARDGAELARHASEARHEKPLMVGYRQMFLLRNSAIRNHRRRSTVISLPQRDSMSRQTKPATEQATVAARFS